MRGCQIVCSEWMLKIFEATIPPSFLFGKQENEINDVQIKIIIYNKTKAIKQTCRLNGSRQWICSHVYHIWCFDAKCQTGYKIFAIASIREFLWVGEGQFFLLVIILFWNRMHCIACFRMHRFCENLQKCWPQLLTPSWQQLCYFIHKPT